MFIRRTTTTTKSLLFLFQKPSSSLLPAQSTQSHNSLCNSFSTSTLSETNVLKSDRKAMSQAPVERSVLTHLKDIDIGMRKRGRRTIAEKDLGRQLEMDDELRARVSKPFEYLCSVRRVPLDLPVVGLPEIAFAGRSNVGKSSLLRSLAIRGLTVPIQCEDRPGTTRAMNFYEMRHSARLVDLPGYGFAFASEQERNSWNEAMQGYVADRATLKKVFICVDARHGLKPVDHEFLEVLDKAGKPSQIILTKTDLVEPARLARRHYLVRQELLTRYKHAYDKILFVDAPRKKGLHLLWEEIASLMNPSDVRDTTTDKARATQDHGQDEGGAEEFDSVGLEQNVDDAAGLQRLENEEAKRLQVIQQRIRRRAADKRQRKLEKERLKSIPRWQKEAELELRRSKQVGLLRKTRIKQSKR